MISAILGAENSWKRPRTPENGPHLASGRPVSPSRVALAYLVSAGISCQAPRESAYVKMQKSWHVAKFFEFEIFTRNFLKSWFWLGNQLASVIQVLVKTCQTCRFVFRRAQYWYVYVDLHLDWPSTDLDLQFSPGSYNHC